jgi:hypothetical protein
MIGSRFGVRRRKWFTVLPVLAVSGASVVCCQQVLGIDEGKLVPAGTGAATTSSGSAGATTSSSGTSTSTGGGSTSTSSSSSGIPLMNDCDAGMAIDAASMIDDCEGNSPGIIMQGGRSGSWFTYNDGTDGGMQTPAAGGSFLPQAIPGMPCGDMHGMHTFGGGFTSYGAGIGFDLNHPNSKARMPYDAHLFHGITFFALGPPVPDGGTQAGTQSVQVQFLESGTTPNTAGGTCDPTSMTCNAHWSATVPITGSGWNYYTVDWGMQTPQITQPSWGTPATWDPSTLLAIQFYVNPAKSFDFWVDNIAFY